MACSVNSFEKVDLILKDTIIAKNFRQEEADGYIRAVCDIQSDGFPETLYFDVHPEGAEAVDVEEPNWALHSLLYPAMLLGRDLVIEADISPYLLNNARNDLGHLIKSYHPTAHYVKIKAGATADPWARKTGQEVVTGLSCGVDSFCTALKYLEPDVPPAARLTGVAVYQVGAFGENYDRSVIESAYARTLPVAQELGVKLYAVTSNIDGIYEGVVKRGFLGIDKFNKSVSFRNAAAASVLQREIGLYLASGTTDFSGSSYTEANSSEYLEPTLGPLMSSEQIRFQCGGAGLDRPKKLDFIANYDIARRGLDVCTTPYDRRVKSNFKNCGRCWKCAATLAMLEDLGRLEDFDQAFDIISFKNDSYEVYRIWRDWVLRRNENPTEYKKMKKAGIVMPPLLNPRLIALLALPGRVWRKAMKTIGRQH